MTDQPQPPAPLDLAAIRQRDRLYHAEGRYVAATADVRTVRDLVNALDAAQQRITALEAVAVAAHRFANQADSPLLGRRVYVPDPRDGEWLTMSYQRATWRELVLALPAAGYPPGEPAALPPRYQPVDQGEGE